MIIYTKGFEEGYNEIIALYGNGKEMMMDVGVAKLAKGSTFSLLEEEKEAALLLLAGEAEFQWNGQKKGAVRRSLHDEMPACLHVPKGVAVQVSAQAETEIYVQKTLNPNAFKPVFYTPADIQCTAAGTGDALQGTMRRNIRTVFDYGNAPYSNMVLGEVVNFPGKWSSYPPHYHPQPEVYFYKFDHPQGFGASFIGPDAFTIRHNSLSLIRGNVCHPQAAAPGYAMFYIWGIRHLAGDPWIKTRIDAREHEWLLAADAAVWDEQR